MNEPSSPLLLRIFLSSPSDVADERGLAFKVIDRLPYDPLLIGQIDLRGVAWDKPIANAPLLATMDPQEAISRGLPKPSECDVVVVIFWARMGTPMPENYVKPGGGRYLSGTEWEYEEAMQAARISGKPWVIVYKRTEDVRVSVKDPDVQEKLAQYERVEDFFKSFKNSDGSIKQGWNTYFAPSEFENLFEHHLRDYISRLLRDRQHKLSAEVNKATPQLWKGSPFPGLRALGPEDAPIFFGRGPETDGLVGRVGDVSGRFVAVVGASGSGKSSLVGAGLLPRLADRAIEGSGDWIVIRFTPGEVSDDPFVALAVKLSPLLERHGLRTREVASELSANPGNLDKICETLLADRPQWSQVLLFIDQFEELFTLVSPQKRKAFISTLCSIASAKLVRVVATLRADFYAKCVELPQLAELLREGSYPLAAPSLDALYEMITRPAARAGLEFEEGLAERILKDTGTNPGALALMAYALDELYRSCQGQKYLTHKAYENFGGVQGAIGTRAENTFNVLDTQSQATLPEVFRNLVDVGKRGVATRLRANLYRVTNTDPSHRLVTALTDARLLVQNIGEDKQPMVEVAHEALLYSWPRLAEWIENTWRSKELVQGKRSDTHNREMGKRRESAIERTDSGRIFTLEAGEYDGEYSWVVISPDFYHDVLASSKWEPDTTLGYKTSLRYLGKELKRIILRLRGIRPEYLREIVEKETYLIGEYWPNAKNENYRGINIVNPDPHKWRKQDIVPASNKVFSLTIKNDVLWLELKYYIRRPS